MNNQVKYQAISSSPFRSYKDEIKNITMRQIQYEYRYGVSRDLLIKCSHHVYWGIDLVRSGEIPLRAALNEAFHDA